MPSLISRFWFEDDGQDIAEYAVRLAVIDPGNCGGHSSANRLERE
jgi:hypothetical protein